VTKKKPNQTASTRHDVKLLTLTRKRLNRVRDYFGLSQSAMVDEALTSHLILKGVTYEEILGDELATLTRTDSD
jgi:hypothetical protein